ncbi:MAG: DNA-processing protein DprA, partial [Cytophagales bacterium]
MEKEDHYAMALSRIKNVGNRTYKSLVDFFGSAEAVLNAPFRALKTNFSTKNIAFNIKTEARGLMVQATQDISKCKAAGISIIPYGDKRYPHRLKHIYDPPSLLYSLGAFDLNKKKMVAIVGTRNASSYGERFVRELVAQLSTCRDLVVVSGLAAGIDICAHRAALAYGLPTVAVTATGLDTTYPSVHKKEAGEISRQGCVLSEHPLGVKVEKYCFPIRNRIIAGLVDAVIVVEAGEKSGALITARYANEFNRDVFAVPGKITSAHSKGCHHLIKTHQAHMITSAQDLSYIMNWDVPKTLLRNTSKNLTNEEMTLIGGLSVKEPLKIASLSVEAGLPVEKILAVVMQL